MPEPVDPADEWDAELDRIVAESVLAQLPEQHRTVLALRYMDDCSVPECAELIGRTVHATEALLAASTRENFSEVRWLESEVKRLSAAIEERAS